MAWTTPSTKTTGTLITAAEWNNSVVSNPIALRAGSIALASQAIGDLTYASSTTQLGRVAAVAAGQVLTSAGTGTVPAYSATPALTSVDMGGTTVYGSRAITVDTGGALNVVLASAGGDDFTVDTDKLVVSGDSGAVGVGTATPVKKLDVSTATTGDGLRSINTNASGGIGAIFLETSLTSPSTVRNWGLFNNASVAGNFEIKSSNAAGGDAYAAGTTRVTITSAGNVGIGTVGPGSKLEVAGDAANTAENSAQLQLIGSTDANKQLRIGYNTTDNNGFIQAVRVGTGQDALLLNPEGGNVGIGVTPDAKLDIDAGTGEVQIRTLNNNALTITENDADAIGGDISFKKSRGTYASPGDVVSADNIGTITTAVYSGTMYFGTAEINFAVDDTFTSNTRPPSRMTFSTNTANAAVTERMRITSAGLVGIGTAAPDRQLEVVTSAVELAVFNSTATNGGTVEFERSGIRRVVIGTELGVTLAGSNNNGLVAGSHSGDGGCLIVMGNYNQAGSGVVFANGTTYPMLDGNSYLGHSSYRWHTVYASVGTINTSDEREKRDIVDSSLGLDFINRLRPVSYRWRDPVGIKTGDTQFFGMTAQDVDEVAPPGTAFVSKENPDSWGLSYGEFTAPMIKAIQELSSRVQELEASPPSA